MNTIKRTVDLAAGVTLDRLDRLFAQDNKNAHTFEITVKRGSESVDLSGANVKAYMILADESTVPIEGEDHVQISGNVASVTLDEHCYAVVGRFNLIINATIGDVRCAIYWADGTVSRTMTDTIVDPGNVIPSLDDLLDKIADVERATTDANAAAERANTAADNIADAVDRAQQAVEDAEEAVGKAQAWANADMSVEMLEPDAQPQVSVGETAEGNMQIHLSIPRGESGNTPDITLTVETGAAGTQATVTKGGTEDAPTFHLVIPRGDTGAVEGLEYYDEDPAALAEAAAAGVSELVARGDHVHPLPTPEEIGALRAGGFAKIEMIGEAVSNQAWNKYYTFSEPPEDYEYFFARVGLASTGIFVKSGSQLQRRLYLASIAGETTSLSNITIYYVVLQVRLNNGATTVPKIWDIYQAATITINTSGVTYSLKTGVSGTFNLGPFYGIKLA